MISVRINWKMREYDIWREACQQLVELLITRRVHFSGAVHLSGKDGTRTQDAAGLLCFSRSDLGRLFMR